MNIQELIIQAGKHLREEFEVIKNTNPHYGERGTETEDILQKFLNDHLPKRFAAGSGFIIDDQNNISPQVDVIIYDSLDSLIYRPGHKSLILPSDNVAAAVEVKSLLNKNELKDAADKISSIKKLSKTPITNIDQPVTFSTLITTKTLGIVFAYDSTTSLETLAINLREINENIPSNQWIDIVVIIDKGIIGYTVQNPFEEDFIGYFGGEATSDFSVFPIYLHLVKEDLGELTLNRFLVNLMGHLTFYRKRSSVISESILGKQDLQCMTLQGYQFNLKRELVPVELSHQQGHLLPSLIKFNLYSTRDEVFIGQITWMPWQDGCAISYSGHLGPPQLIFKPYFKAAGSKIMIMPGMKNANLWLSSVIPLSKERFIEISENLKGEVIAKYFDGDEDKEFPDTLDKYNSLYQKKNQPGE